MQSVGSGAKSEASPRDAAHSDLVKMSHDGRSPKGMVVQGAHSSLTPLRSGTRHGEDKVTPGDASECADAKDNQSGETPTRFLGKLFTLRKSSTFKTPPLNIQVEISSKVWKMLTEITYHSLLVDVLQGKTCALKYGLLEGAWIQEGHMNILNMSPNTTITSKDQLHAKFREDVGQAGDDMLVGCYVGTPGYGVSPPCSMRPLINASSRTIFFIVIDLIKSYQAHTPYVECYVLDSKDEMGLRPVYWDTV